jgi:uncharacterized membrane protein
MSPGLEEQPVDAFGPLGLGGWAPCWLRVRRDTIVAVNVGCCLIPLSLVIWETLHLLRLSGLIAGALVLAVILNVAICDRVEGLA